MSGEGKPVSEYAVEGEKRQSGMVFRFFGFIAGVSGVGSFLFPRSKLHGQHV